MTMTMTMAMAATDMKVDEHERRQGPGQYVGFVTYPLTRGGTPIDPGVLPALPGLGAENKQVSIRTITSA